MGPSTESLPVLSIWRGPPCASSFLSSSSSIAQDCLVLCLVPSERARRAGRIRPCDCLPASRVVCGVRVPAPGFSLRGCLSPQVPPLCYIARSQSSVARTWSWTVSHSTREAQRSSESVASRHDAGPFVLNTNLRPLRTADHPRRERHCGQGLVRCADAPRAAPFRQGGNIWPRCSVPTRLARDQAQRVNVRIGCAMQYEFKWK
jgi:hypothetical protein